MNRVLAHAAGGGITSALQGQKFGPGALSAGFTQEIAPGITGLGGNGFAGVMERTVAASVLGGTASVMGGGNFANGARTAAFARLFNSEAGKIAHEATALLEGAHGSASALIAQTATCDDPREGPGPGGSLRWLR